MAKVTTARSGAILRAYAESRAGAQGVAIFPEYGLDANEQAAFLMHHGGDFEEVITLSPFIISEAANGQLVVLGPDQDAEHVMLRHGDSVNKVTMSLWRRETIGRQPATRQVARQASP